MALPSQQLANQPFNFGSYIIEVLYWTFVNSVTYFFSYSFLVFPNTISLIAFITSIDTSLAIAPKKPLQVLRVVYMLGKISYND